MASVQLKSLDDGNITDVPESGVTVVGRGPFLEITDKRVSRNHANLEIVDGKLYLTPIHVNPCFFKKSGEGSQKILEKDEKFCLEEGDVFGLLPDQLFFKVLYKNKPVNGDIKQEPESVPSQTNGDTKSENKADPDDNWDKSSDNEKEGKKIEVKVETKPDVKYDVKSENNNDKESSASGAGPSTVTPPGQKEMALPLERKRQLPVWLIQAAKTAPLPQKKKPSPKVPAPSKRAPRAATSKPIPEAFLTDGEDDEVIPVKKSRGRPAPRKPPKDSFSEGESEEEPPPKPKNRSKTLTPGTRTPRRKDQYNSDEEDSDEPVTRKAKPIPRRTARPPTPESFTPSKRPVRAAKYARGSYEDEVSDEYDELGASQKKYEDDSDFIMEDDDSGSDWGSKKSKGKGKGKVPAKNTPKPRSTAKGSRSRGRSRKSRSDVDSDEYLDEYVPRPSKRRASKAAKSESEEESSPPPKPQRTKKKKADSDDEDDGDDEPQTRKPCEFGKKCYRKNPAHFKEFCHPGDKSYDEAEDDEDVDDDKPECPYGTSCFRTNTAHKEQYSHNNKPRKDTSRPKRENAGKKSLLEGDEDDDGDKNTYNYNDSFIDNNEGEESEESFFDPAEEDSDYDPESEDVAGLVKDAKGFQKNKKLVKPARSR